MHIYNLKQHKNCCLLPVCAEAFPGGAGRGIFNVIRADGGGGGIRGGGN